MSLEHIHADLYPRPRRKLIDWRVVPGVVLRAAGVVGFALVCAYSGWWAWLSN